MKKIVSLILYFAVINAGLAQNKKVAESTNQTPTLNKITVSSRSVAKVLPQQPDIIVSNLSISKEGSYYYASYTLKNIGNAPVKKGWLWAQGYINNTISACGGANTTTMMPEKDEMLNPGESISGKLPINPTGLTIGSTYTYILSAMNAKKINEGTPSEQWICENYKFQESNIENNLKTATFILQL